MKTLGIDIGTTTISAVVCEGGRTLAARNIPNDSFLPGAPWERIQDPLKIWESVESITREMLQENPSIAAIGLTGQMHGILYLDRDGNCVSPLYTWQDGRGGLPYDDRHSWASCLSEYTGYALSSGYGLVTHFYNLNHNLVPENAAVFCTIMDYAAMRLAGLAAPRQEATCAASLGVYDCVSHRFDTAALTRAGIGCSMLPAQAESPCLGIGPLGLPVYTAIGDNQASFLGATEGKTDALLINMGTGGQVSVYSPNFLATKALETRPYPGGGYLMVGASLCGGRSYAILERFFAQTVKMVTGQEVNAYDAMARILDATPLPQSIPQTATTFRGTRQDPTLRGSITGLTPDNFTPECLIYSVMEGMARELHGMYQGYLDLGGKAPLRMVGSGNGLRKNPHLCRVFEEVFGCPLTLSRNEEEAACGAALFAAQNSR